MVTERAPKAVLCLDAYHAVAHNRAVGVRETSPRRGWSPAVLQDQDQVQRSDTLPTPRARARAMTSVLRS